MNRCLVLLCPELKAASQPVPSAPGPRAEPTGYLWEVRPRVKEKPGQLFLGAPAVGFLFFPACQGQGKEMPCRFPGSERAGENELTANIVTMSSSPQF